MTMVPHQAFSGRSADLLDIPYSFTQQELLSPHDFCKRSQERGVQLELGHLEALHAADRLLPLYYLPPLPSKVQKHLGNSAFQGIRDNLAQLRDLGYLLDPREQPFKPWWRFKGGDGSSRTEMLYSPFQLLALPVIKELLPLMHRRRGQEPFNIRLDWGPKAYPRPVLPAGEIIPLNLMAALHLADSVYFSSSIVRSVRYAGGSADSDMWFDSYRKYVDTFKPMPLLRWLGEDAAWILDQAEQLTIQAGGVDPNRVWLDLIRLMSPAKWEELKGDARSALDLRLASECLNLLYDDLVRHAVAPRRIPLPKRASHPQRERLRDDQQELDPVLTDYGLSPHPAVVLVVEGSSDELLLHRVMSHLRLPYYRSRVQIFSAGGDTKNFDLLASFAAVPELGERVPGHRFILLRRPLTRYMVVLDKVPADLERNCLDPIWAQLPKKYRTPKAREELGGVVTVETWGGYGASMEYANFTDDEIAAAVVVASAKRGVAVPSLASRVSELRKTDANLKTTLLKREPQLPRPYLTKLELADALWPILRPRVRADFRRSEPQIPLVRVLLAAERLARSTVRHSLGMNY